MSRTLKELLQSPVQERKKMTPEKDRTIKATGLEGETLSPWQKARELLTVIEERQGEIVIENPNSRIELYAQPNGVEILLYDVVRYHHPGSYRRKAFPCTDLIMPLRACLVLDFHHLSYIATGVRSSQDSSKLNIAIYLFDKPLNIGSSMSPLPADEDIEVGSRQVIERLPFDSEMPQQIDFEATMGQICDIALRIVRDSKENPELKSEDVEALKAVVFGQAIKH